MNKLEAIEYLLSKVIWSSGEAFSCVRVIVEDLNEPIDIKDINKMIDGCNE